MDTMNYSELVKYIESVCLQHPFVNSFYYGIYHSSEANNICYGSIILTPGSINTANTTNEFSFNIMYVDRLTEDRSNLIQVQSESIDIIRSILSVISNDVDIIDYETGVTVNVFFEQFADNVAGGVGTISITLPSNTGECTWYDHCPTC